MARKKSMNPVALAIAASLVSAYIRLVYAFVRWEYVNVAAQSRLVSDGAPFVVAFWHSRLLMMAVLQKSQARPLAVLSSKHRDAEVMVQVMQHFNIETKRGSSTNPLKKHKKKGGAAALRALVEALRAGYNVAMTPDGPTGPREHSKPGTAQLGAISGAYIMPIAYATQFAIRPHSWDRFFLPLPVPFSRGVFVFGDPIKVTARDAAGLEAATLDIDAAIRAVTEEADRRVGQPVLPPVPRVFTPEADDEATS